MWKIELQEEISLETGTGVCLNTGAEATAAIIFRKMREEIASRRMEEAEKGAVFKMVEATGKPS